ncbi:MAG: hypothetical protein PHQ23_14510 [Candidatus Wallbacteria bacterium]|nr:hypothetical protein [Candidatus Wallbacteria bacterium]
MKKTQFILAGLGCGIASSALLHGCAGTSSRTFGEFFMEGAPFAFIFFLLSLPFIPIGSLLKRLFPWKNLSRKAHFAVALTISLLIYKIAAAILIRAAGGDWDIYMIFINLIMPACCAIFVGMFWGNSGKSLLTLMIFMILVLAHFANTSKNIMKAKDAMRKSHQSQQH